MSEAGGTPLAAKLGIKPGSRLLLVGAPALPALDDLPPGVSRHTRPGREPYDVIVLFCPMTAVLHERFAGLVPRLAVAGALWVGWPKKASGVRTDLTETGWREHGLAHGLVDVKIASIDATWSGLKFVRRLSDRGAERSPR